MWKTFCERSCHAALIGIADFHGLMDTGNFYSIFLYRNAFFLYYNQTECETIRICLRKWDKL